MAAGSCLPAPTQRLRPSKPGAPAKGRDTHPPPPAPSLVWTELTQTPPKGSNECLLTRVSGRLPGTLRLGAGRPQTGQKHQPLIKPVVPS